MIYKPDIQLLSSYISSSSQLLFSQFTQNQYLCKNLKYNRQEKSEKNVVQEPPVNKLSTFGIMEKQDIAAVVSSVGILFFTNTFNI